VSRVYHPICVSTNASTHAGIALPYVSIHASISVSIDLGIHVSTNVSTNVGIHVRIYVSTDVSIMSIRLNNMGAFLNITECWFCCLASLFDVIRR
jgi:hypothetical protein